MKTILILLFAFIGLHTSISELAGLCLLVCLLITIVPTKKTNPKN